MVRTWPRCRPPLSLRPASQPEALSHLRVGDTNLIAVCGPNASGKTRLGVQLALGVGGEILSVDSRQVYRHLDIGSGKDLAEYDTPSGRVPYHLIDLVEPSQVYTLWQYQGDFYRIFREIRARDRLPVAVGGTGLYLEAVLRSFQIPDIPENPVLRQELEELPRDELEAKLREGDAQLHARTDTTSKRRIIRALEVAMVQREHPVAWGHENVPDIRPLVIGVHWERAELRRRIEKRLDQRLREGMVEEVRGLMEIGVGIARLNQLGLEYRHVARFLSGAATHADMRRDLLRDISRLAKRQETYFRGMARRGTPIHWVEEANVEAAKEILDATL